MKKTSLTKITAIVLLVTLVALAIISGTFAKYAEQYAGEGTAIVAKWDVNVTDLDGTALTESTTFDLFNKSKVYDLSKVANVNDLSEAVGEVDDNVAKGTDKAIVAPGTWGKVGFKIKIAASNEVKVKYGVDITDIQNNIAPLEFSVDGKNWTTANDVKTLTTKVVGPSAEETEETVTLYWRWLYENGTEETLTNNDNNDKTLATAENRATCSIKATLGAIQVD